MDKAKFEKAKEIDAEICKCNDILKKMEICDSVAFRDGDIVNGCAYRYSSTTGELFDAIFRVTTQYIIDRRAECEKIMKAKSMLTITIGALFSKLPKPKVDDVITDVEFEK